MYIPSAPDALITILLGVWAAIALMSLLRLLPGLHHVYALRDRCEPFPADVEARLPLWLDARSRGRRTQLLVCHAVPGATVLGFHNPCIAIPPALVNGLTTDELDQVILHEHAHVQRFDDWSRLVQTLLMSVLWIHPAALVVSRALSREREMACDECVVARTGKPKAYARCLARAAELRLQMRGASMLVPALLGGRLDLMRRVDRVLALRTHARRHASRGAAAVAACGIIAMSVQLQSVRFAEIADIVLPQVIRATLWANAPTLETPDGLLLASATVRLEADPTYVRRSFPNASNTPNAPNVPAPNAPNAPDAPNASDLFARSFPGAYDASTFAPAAHIASADKPLAPFAPVAPLAPRIASAAKKSSLAIASAFTRAGVSLARSF